MKSALQNLSVILPIHMTPLQVSSEGRSNGNNGEAYDVLTEWENNADNAPGAAKRVEESSNKNLLFEFNRRIMEKLIDRYDYKAVQTMVNEMRELVPSQFQALLKAAIDRHDLKCSEARSAFTRLGYPNMMQPKYTRECEYLLLQIQVQTKAYSDFLRSMTPFILAIFQSALDKVCGYSIHDYIKNDKWDKSKLTGSALDGKFEQQPIYKKYHTLPPKPLRGQNPKGFVLSWHLVNLFENLTDPKNKLDYELFVKAAIEIREFEEKERNFAAHTMKSFTASDVKEKTGMTPEMMFEKIVTFVNRYTLFPTDKTMLNSYVKKNQALRSLLTL